MSLTLALAIVAGLVLAAIVAHGAWSARRAHPRQAEPPAVVEPSAAAAATDDGPTLDPVFDAPVADEEPVLELPEAPPAALRRGGRLDALIDAIARLTLDAPVRGDAVVAHLPATRRAGTKPFLVEGLAVESGDWEAPVAGRRYAELQAGVQMANRQGALNEIEYSEFVQKVQTFADEIGALPDFADMLDVVARARELDAFASGHDAQLSVILRSNGASWSVGYLQQCAARHGFVAGAVPGRIVLPGAAEGAPPLLAIAFDAQAAMQEDPGLAAVRRVTLSLDVPQTPAAAEPFALWQQVARALANDMDATLVDEQGIPITLHTFTTIGSELKRLYDALEAHDVAAGSPAARRLFA